MTKQKDEDDGFNITHVHEENPECPYCGQQFNSPKEEGSHRAECSEAAFKENAPIPCNPDVNGKKENKVNDWEKENNKKLFQKGEA